MRRVLFVAAALALAGCAQDVLNTESEVRGLEGAAPLQTLADPESGTEVNLRVGGQVRIELDANATTGYVWEVTQQDQTAVTLISSDYFSDPSPPRMVGVGGTRVFVFEGVKPSDTDLELTLQRSPEDVANKLQLQITIE